MTGVYTAYFILLICGPFLLVQFLNVRQAFIDILVSGLCFLRFIGLSTQNLVNSCVAGTP